MNIRLVKVFAEVCAAGSVTGAAERLRMTQPAVTHAIQALERESGLVLFDRLSRRLHITESGKLYLEKALRLLELCDELDRTAGDLEQQAPLRIGSCITIACFWLPEILKRFAAGCDAPVTTEVASASSVMEMLDDNAIDLGLHEGAEPREPYIAMPFSSYRLVPVCSRRHRFASAKRVTVESLLKERLLLREPGSAIRDVFDSFLRLRQVAATPAMTSVNSQALIRAVAANLGVSVLPDVIVAPELKKGGIAQFNVEGMRLENANRVVFHADKYRTGPMQHFIGCAMGGK